MPTGIAEGTPTGNAESVSPCMSAKNPSTPRWIKEFKPNHPPWMTHTLTFKDELELNSTVTNYTHIPSARYLDPLDRHFYPEEQFHLDNAFFEKHAPLSSKAAIHARKQAFDLYHEVRGSHGRWPADAHLVFQGELPESTRSPASVSYTHLTLPTNREE